MNNLNQMYELCSDHMHGYVMVETTNGTMQDGIITGIDEQNVYMAVPMNQREESSQDRSDEQQLRQYPGYGYGYGYGHPGYNHYGGYPGYGYGGYPGYNYGYGQGGRSPFKRLILPLAAITALSVLPWY